MFIANCFALFLLAILQHFDDELEAIYIALQQLPLPQQFFVKAASLSYSASTFLAISTNQVGNTLSVPQTTLLPL